MALDVLISLFRVVVALLAGIAGEKSGASYTSVIDHCNQISWSHKKAEANFGASIQHHATEEVRALPTAPTRRQRESSPWRTSAAPLFCGEMRFRRFPGGFEMFGEK